MPYKQFSQFSQSELETFFDTAANAQRWLLHLEVGAVDIDRRLIKCGHELRASRAKFVRPYKKEEETQND